MQKESDPRKEQSFISGTGKHKLAIFFSLLVKDGVHIDNILRRARISQPPGRVTKTSVNDAFSQEKPAREREYGTDSISDGYSDDNWSSCGSISTLNP